MTNCVKMYVFRSCPEYTPAFALKLLVCHVAVVAVRC